MPDLRVAASFQDVDETDEITVNIGMGIGDGLAHAGLGAEVNDAVGPF